MRYSLTTLSLIFLLLSGSNYKETPKLNKLTNQSINPLLQINFKNIRDTIYTLRDHIIEINLITHNGTVKFRNGKTKIFPISGGTKNISDGIETREGLFALHWKSKKLYSTQFDSTLMLYWMSYNSGIGIHALNTNGYYRYLGKKNVSHGCVRASREDAEEIFSFLERGTPVLVHNGSSVVTIAFHNSKEKYKYYSSSEMIKLLPKRYDALYNRRYFIDNNEKIIIDENNVNASGLPIGNVENIPSEQIVFTAVAPIYDEIAELDNVNIISSKNKKNSEFLLPPDSYYVQK